MIDAQTMFYCLTTNRHPRSGIAAWEVETVVHWVDEHGDRNTEAVRDADELERLVDVYSGDVEYGVYARKKDGTAAHIKDFDTVRQAMQFVELLNGTEIA